MRRLLRNLWRQPPTDKTIDIVAQDNEGNIILGVVDLTDWGSVEKNRMLQERINLCMEFLDSGQLRKKYPNAEGKQVTIRCITQSSRTWRVRIFLRQYQDRSEALVLVLNARNMKAENNYATNLFAGN